MVQGQRGEQESERRKGASRCVCMDGVECGSLGVRDKESAENKFNQHLRMFNVR